MARVKQGLKDITTLDLIAKSKHIIAQITANFTPPPLLAEVIAATNALDAAYMAAYGRGTLANTIKKEKREHLLLLLITLAAWVDMVSRGSAEKILKSGFETRKRNTPLGLLPPPREVTTITIKMEGCLLIRWKPVHRKGSYRVEINEGDMRDESQWEIIMSVTKTKAMLRGLKSQKKYWVRIRTISAAGTSGSSVPVEGLVW